MKHPTIKYFLAIGIVFALSYCKNKKLNETNQTISLTQNRSLKIFRSTEKVNLFVLRINDDFSYRDSLNKNYSKPWKLIKEYYLAGDSINIYLKIDNKDTSFVYNVIGIDSILFGRMSGQKFYIRNNLHKEAWLFD